MSERPTSNEGTAAVPASRIGTKQAHVLVADGNAASRERRRARLIGAGFHVSVARTGFEAIVKATCEVPDVILLDDTLPDIEAPETRRLITTCPVTAHIPVLSLTSDRGLTRRIQSLLRDGTTQA